jgi:hypothetical protein
MIWPGRMTLIVWRTSPSIAHDLSWFARRSIGGKEA